MGAYGKELRPVLKPKPLGEGLHNDQKVGQSLASPFAEAAGLISREAASTFWVVDRDSFLLRHGHDLSLEGEYLFAL